MTLRLALYLILLFTIGCDESTTSIDARCEIEFLQPEEAWTRGSTVTLQAYPLSSLIDTTVLINDTDIPILSIDTNTESCIECSSCRELELCSTCGFCDACALNCTDCLHAMELSIPTDLPQASEYLLTIINGFGSNSAVAINILDTNVSE